MSVGTEERSFVDTNDLESVSDNVALHHVKGNLQWPTHHLVMEERHGILNSHFLIALGS